MRGCVEGLAGSAPARHREVDAAFNEVVSSFAGDDGSLGVYKGKVVDHLGVGTVVGRNESTAHDQMFLADATWTAVADKLQRARDERTVLAVDKKPDLSATRARPLLLADGAAPPALPDGGSRPDHGKSGRRWTTRENRAAPEHLLPHRSGTGS
ncbi:hypothetical protein [Lentzea albida]|uniref:Uncharacterized protein n=1 Tax=Lentzea albida TaxID=65499 RepID=A0A1H9PTG3_9PSEU|nr:hypothetical protein [Lentzea albida]SER51586.1 hypothetical protein SAMN04488000_109255 [Lentzea albida]